MSVKEYIYYESEEVHENNQTYCEHKLLYSSRNKPMEFEDQTPVIVVQTETEHDMNLLLDLLGMV